MDFKGCDEKQYSEHYRVSIFGSARIEEDDSIYKDIYELARLIAAEDIDVVTGGGPGLMQAANEGHKHGRTNSEIHSFGLNIKLPREQKANRHLDIKMEFDTFSERLDNFMLLSNAVVVAPGGVGTLLEFSYTWQLCQVKHIDYIPIILFGKMWGDFMKWAEKWLLKYELLDQADMDKVFVAKDMDEVMDIIRIFHEAYNKGEKIGPWIYRKKQ